ncbi:hypothetical protein GLE_3691 [Lysobacter enzymogenes]|uniref:Uncharacterized protein n=1 Tax=Lysobacter enzymogenes TaxID=69 RepID=A0A0S2DK64_LYSEN|nr:hypothetical protein GLE_3691 [Lysobacter enzymogenes]
MPAAGRRSGAFVESCVAVDRAAFASAGGRSPVLLAALRLRGVERDLLAMGTIL